jgi:anaerobic selenocysteine-containing dehydrogenase
LPERIPKGVEMPEVNRRTFLKVSAFTAGAVATAYSLGKFLPLLEERPETDEGPKEPVLLAGEDYFPTTCWVGKQNCGISARRYKGRIVKLEGHIMHPQNSGKLCPKGQAQLLSFYDPYRIKAPLVRVNGKGVPGEFAETSWDEALALVGDKMKEARVTDPRLVVWQKGRDEVERFFDEALVMATGATMLRQGAQISDAGVRATEYTVGQHAFLSPDLRYCNYLIIWGWNLLGTGGNNHCWLTHQQEFMAARERGMKVVTLDPRLGGVGPHTDKWLPIRPGTDLAFFLAVAHVLVNKRFIDEEYIKHHTNGPFLVKGDGSFLKVGGKEQVLDASGEVRAFDEAGVDPQLEGEGEVDGTVYKVAFQVYRDHIDQYTPEWAADITGLEAETIQAVAEDLGDQALLGSKLTIDPSKAKPCYAACHGDPFEGAGGVAEGVPKDYVYRPVGIMADHVSQQEMGFQASRAALQVFMLLGAIDAVGGVHAGLKREVHDSFEGWDDIKVRDPPYDIDLAGSKFFPISSVNTALAAQVIDDPEPFGVDYTPEVMIVHTANPVVTTPNQAEVKRALEKMQFVAVINPWMNETADYFADVVLPSATIEKYEGPLDVSTMYTEATSMRLPPMAPLFRSRGDIDIFIDLAERAGVLYGDGGYLDHLNQMLQFQIALALPLDAKPEVRDIMGRWAKSNGYEGGVRFFETNGVRGENRPPDDIYAAPDDRTVDGIRHRFYGDSLKATQDTMKDKGAGEAYHRDYTALPTWRDLTMDGSPGDYDLSLISYRKVQYIQDRATAFVHMNELEPEQRLLMNTRTAEERGIHEDDEVLIESHNAVTGETQSVRTAVQLIEGIRPDTVALSRHYGGWVHPWVRDGGPTANTLFFSGEGYVTNTADQAFQVRVRVSRTG